jgi:hypothetical protein
MRSQLRWQSIVKGIGTRLPIVSDWANSAAGHPVTARYFYAVWLRHLVRLWHIRPGFSFDVVAELGPGDALGLGMCALLSGAQRYIGLDRLPFGLRADNVAMLDELYALFARRADIPSDDEMPGVYPRLTDYRFPSYILNDARLDSSLSVARLEGLRAALTGEFAIDDSRMLSYAAPWDTSAQVRPASVDLLLSQAVLEHVDDVDGAYTAMHHWLKPTGLMSHRIDYSSHGITHDWFGHWTVSPGMWNVVRGKRAYLINRLPHSAHLAAMQRAGLKVLAVDPTLADRAAPAQAMRITHDAADLCIKGAHVIAQVQGA